MGVGRWTVDRRTDGSPVASRAVLSRPAGSLSMAGWLPDASNRLVADSSRCLAARRN
jgi:hypothetical protein